MCGICGYFSFQNKISSKNILEMNDAIRHRGPDDEGFWLSDNFTGKAYSGKDSTEKIRQEFPLLRDEKSEIAIGFRRLSILDLSENGHQPMISASQKIILTFNGEIYNFKTLRIELEECGHHFTGNSDTEVVLKSYEEWGSEMFVHFDGMFSICVIDLNLNKIVLSRDRVGLKPLFYFKNNQHFVWASEIKSLLKNEHIKPEVNWEGVYTNFLFQTTLAPHTCFKDIFSLEPGAVMTVDLNTFKTEKTFYWQIPAEIQKITSEEAAKKVDKLLEESIAQQLFADVPVTSMMSGGIDSTLITAKAKPLQNDISAFTVAYPFSETEVENAKSVSLKYNVDHEVYKVDDREILTQLKENIEHFEEPYSSLEVLMNAAEFAKNKGYKVVLSGNGADELFAGYSHSLKLKKWLFLRNFNFIRNFVFTKDDFSKKVKNYFSQDDVFDFFRQSQVAMKPAEAQEIFSREVLKKINPDLQKYHVKEKKNYRDLFLYDMKYSLSSHHVFRDDLSAMKFGVEFRYPYLSNALIDFVATLPEEIVYNGIQNKPLLRKVAGDFLPDEVMNMPKKGFSFPLAHFIRTKKEMQDFVNEHLESLAKRNFFKKEIIQDWWKNCREDYDYIKIWQVVTFEIWYRKYFENA